MNDAPRGPAVTFTVITPTFNSRTTLAQAMTSVLAQEGVDLEYLVIDGGSTDGTVELIREFAAGDPRIRWISEADDGIADAFNKGLALASGAWIGILNSDDRYVPGALQAVSEVVRNNPEVAVVHGEMVRLDEHGTPLFVIKPAEVARVVWHQMPVNHPTMFVSRSAYARYGGFDPSLKVAMDYELVLRFHLAGLKFHAVPAVLAEMSYGGASDTKLVAVRREVYRVTVARGYPRGKAAFFLVDHVVRGMVKRFLRLCGLQGLLRLHPRFHKQRV